MAKDFSLVGAATSAGMIDTGAVRAPGGNLQVTPEALIVTIASQTFTLAKDDITTLSITGGSLSVDTAERNVSGMCPGHRDLVVELQANGYSVQAGKGKSRWILIGIGILLLGILYSAFSAAYGMMR